MPRFRYHTAGTWFKGNTHIHSAASDGKLSFSELAERYRRAGYDFLYRTDHWVASDVSADRESYPLLWLDGIELNGSVSDTACYHVVALGPFKDISPQMGFVPAMEAVREQGGLLILAHPYWCGNSFEDALRFPFDGVEIYNNVCRWLNGKGEGGPHWHAVLNHNPAALGLAVDDSHLGSEHPAWNGGWIAVNAPARTAEHIHGAIRAGNFYSSRGPAFHHIAYDPPNLVARFSPCQVARLAGPHYLGLRQASFAADAPLTEVHFEIPTQWPYVYLEIEDAQGRRAWTNTLFVDNGL